MKKKHIILLSSIGLTLVLTAAIVTAVLLPRANDVDHSSSSVTSETTSEVTSEDTTPSTSVAALFTITWKNYDGTVLKIDEDVLEGTLPVYTGVAPTKQSSAQFSYTFDTWSPTVVLATSNATYTAQFNEEVNRYAVVWQDYDGTPLRAHTVAYGTLPVYDGELPKRAKSAEFTYTFAAWSPEVVAVTGDATYKAIYTETRNNYTVTWLNHDGSELQTDIAVPYGTLPTYDDVDPTKEGDAQSYYTFSGWSPAVGVVTGNATYTATFTTKFRSFNIHLALNGGVFSEPETLETLTVEYGAAYTLPLVTSQTTTPFGGWYYNEEMVADEFGVPLTNFMFSEDITLVAAFYHPIYTRSDLVNISQNLTGTYRLMNDLDLSDEEWVPLDGFAGEFNGQNYTISGMSITSVYESVGLFGAVGDAKIMNVTLSDSHIEFTTEPEFRDLYVGGIVGSSKDGNNLLLDGVKHESAVINVEFKSWGNFAVGGLLGKYDSRLATTLTISNSSNSANFITFGDYYEDIGGFVGNVYNVNAGVNIVNSFNSGNINTIVYGGGFIGRIDLESADITIANSYNSGRISGDVTLGGFIGELQLIYQSVFTITNSANKNDILGTSNHMGGFVGRYSASDTARLDISNSYNTGNITGEEKLGGLLGATGRHFMGGPTHIAITNSYNTGNITGSRESVGGLVGNAHTVNLEISYSYNTGNMSAARDRAGGLVGYAHSGGSITNSINFGAVSANTTAGGIIGGNNNDLVVISDSYYTNDITYVNGNPFVNPTLGGNYTLLATVDASFFSATLLFDEEVWDLSNTDPSNALYPSLK